MKIGKYDSEWIQKELQSMETEEETKRRKLGEVKRQLELKIEYEQMLMTQKCLERMFQDIYCTEMTVEDGVVETTYIAKKNIVKFLTKRHFKSRIDTVEIRDTIDNRENNIVSDIKGTQTRITIHNNIITKYNPNNRETIYDNEYKLSKTETGLIQMKKDLKLIDPNRARIVRVDIATDVDVPFNDINKFLDLLHKCLRIKEVNGTAWMNSDEKNLQVSNYMFRNRCKLEIEFYDKLKESGGKALLPTRLEVRYLRVSSQNLAFHIEKAISLWKEAPDNLGLVEDMIIGVLQSKWREEEKKNKVSLSAFVYKYSKYFYTLNVVKALYKESGLKGNYQSWLQEFRSKYDIILYNITDLRNITKFVVSSLNEYMKS